MYASIYGMIFIIIHRYRGNREEMATFLYYIIAVPLWRNNKRKLCAVVSTCMEVYVVYIYIFNHYYLISILFNH